MPKLITIKSYNKLYKLIKLEVNNKHFSSTEAESYSNDDQSLDIADVFELKNNTFNLTI